jgi:hypothetical protein
MKAPWTDPGLRELLALAALAAFGCGLALAQWDFLIRRDFFTDLPYAWIAPPKDFVGSADLIAELRLSNDQIADRQTIHLRWMTLSSSTPAQRELDRNEITAVPPISSEIAYPGDREAIRMAPSKERTHRQLNAKEIKRLLKRGKADFKVARPDAGRRAPLTDAYAGDGTNLRKGFWDWSR